MLERPLFKWSIRGYKCGHYVSIQRVHIELYQNCSSRIQFWSLFLSVPTHHGFPCLFIFYFIFFSSWFKNVSITKWCQILTKIFDRLKKGIYDLPLFPNKNTGMKIEPGERESRIAMMDITKESKSLSICPASVIIARLRAKTPPLNSTIIKTALKIATTTNDRSAFRSWKCITSIMKFFPVISSYTIFLNHWCLNLLDFFPVCMLMSSSGLIVAEQNDRWWFYKQFEQYESFKMPTLKQKKNIQSEIVKDWHKHIRIK